MPRTSSNTPRASLRMVIATLCLPLPAGAQSMAGLAPASESMESIIVVGTRLENATDTQYQQVIGYGTPGVSGTLGFHGRL
jgi:hypothetical protein